MGMRRASRIKSIKMEEDAATRQTYSQTDVNFTRLVQNMCILIAWRLKK